MSLSFNKLKLATKINLLTMLSIALFVAFIFIIILPMIRERLVLEKRTQLKNQVESVVSIVASYQNAAAKGAMSADSAQKQATERIKHIRYEGDNYFWVNGPEKFLVHPLKPEIVGKPNSEVKDLRNKDFVTMMIAEGRAKGSSYQEYVWTKGEGNALAPKISYCQYFEPWDWTIATGIYVDDIDAKISSVTKMIIISSLLIAILSVMINILVVRIITKPINLAISAMMNISKGDVNSSSELLDNYLKSTNQAGDRK